MEDSTGTKKKSWFARHKVWTGILAFLVVAAVLGAASPENSKTGESKGVTTKATKTATPAPKAVYGVNEPATISDQTLTVTGVQRNYSSGNQYVKPDAGQEAPRFLDQPTDLGEVLARSREYGVGMTLIGQSLRQFPESLREVALNSARTKIAFGTSATDARRLAEEFGPGVEPDFFTGLGKFEAIGAVSLGGTVSPPFTPLKPKR
jgi:hypothetical protein